MSGYKQRGKASNFVEHTGESLKISDKATKAAFPMTANHVINIAGLKALVSSAVSKGLTCKDPTTRPPRQPSISPPEAVVGDAFLAQR